ncbi:MAG: chromosomal replication initiator protein DnaA [Candidatus Zixiibacteriota bacterium]
MLINDRGGSYMSENVSNSSQWNDCLKYMAVRVKEQSFNIWLKHTKGEPNGSGEFKVTVPNQFVADWIDDHFRELIDEAFVEVLGKPYEVVYIVTGQSDGTDQTSLNFEAAMGMPVALPAINYHHNLNSKYTFESLVVGDFNQFACAAAKAVAEGPGMTRYNPLFIYGGTGLGKTHIVQAIGNYIFEQFPTKRIVYATSEKFTSDFISAISDRSISDFHKVYRDVDVLIIDDIQFFTGKESTQEQFFHTFNTLYHAGKQIILTCDRPPREIKGLEERLLSRFSWGLVTDLQAPDLENRTAILQKKLVDEGASVADAVITHIAEQVRTNIRELEGALTRVLAYAALRGVPVDLELAAKILSDTHADHKKEVTIEAIQRKTADTFRIESGMMTAKKKTAKIALARQVAMYLSRSLTDNSLKTIGAAFGGRDHSTVIHACDLISKRMATDHSFRDKIDKLTAALLY